MTTTNIFYKLPTHSGTQVASIPGKECTLSQLCDYIINRGGLVENDFIIAHRTKVYNPKRSCLHSVSLQNNSHVEIFIPQLGGKGGFGSLLRAIGAQIEKTTNRDACRDLSGRRLRDIKREDEIKKLLALQAKLKEERKRRRKEKIEKLKKRSESSKTSKSIQELVAMFDDHAYNNRRLELGDIIEAAVEKGLINHEKPEKRKQSSDESEDIQEDELQNNKVRPNSSRVKKDDLWLGLEDE